MKFINIFFASICLVLGVSSALVPYLLNQPELAQDPVIFLLGLIGFALFQIAENTRHKGLERSSGESHSSMNGWSGAASKPEAPQSE